MLNRIKDGTPTYATRAEARTWLTAELNREPWGGRTPEQLETEYAIDDLLEAVMTQGAGAGEADPWGLKHEIGAGEFWSEVARHKKH